MFWADHKGGNLKTVGITQRVEYVESYNESRDCLDQRWAVFLLELGLMPIPLPNVEPKNVSLLLDNQFSRLYYVAEKFNLNFR